MLEFYGVPMGVVDGMEWNRIPSKKNPIEPRSTRRSGKVTPHGRFSPQTRLTPEAEPGGNDVQVQNGGALTYGRSIAPDVN